MAIDFVTLALAEGYTDDSISGIGGTLAGKNCTIASITDIPGGHRVTFQWTADDSTTRTQTMDVMDGSGAEAIEQIYADNGVLGAKNLLNNTALTQTINDVTFTPNADGSVTVNGTASADTYYKPFNQVFSVGTYIWNGCPSGGSDSSYWSFCRTNDTTSAEFGKEYGNSTGVSFTLATDKNINYFISVKKGYTANNLIFYPMIRLASDTDSTYAPYAETNYQLTKNKVSWEDNSILGAKNLWSKDAEHTFIKSSARTYEGAELNFKRGDKLTVSFDISDVANFGGTQGICVKFIDQNNVDVSSYYDYGIVAGHYKHTFTITSNPTGKIRAYMFLYNTEPNDNATLKISNIMVYLASDTDDTYVPYAMTNRELTEKISVESLTINLTASDKATKLRDDSRRCGNIVNIRIQLQVTAEIASDTEIFRLNGLPHSGYSTAILGETNTGEIIPLMIQTSDSNFVAYCRKTIPTGYYAISYTYVI